MGLDLKNALATRHREGKLHTSSDAMIWVFQQLRQMPRLPGGPENTKNQPRMVAMHLWRQAQAQFGGMADAVLTHWALASGKDLARCFQELSEMDAIRWENQESIVDFESIGNWKNPTPLSES
jgi:uncharacterized repeat protein (TIGR04138 family)